MMLAPKQQLSLKVTCSDSVMLAALCSDIVQTFGGFSLDTQSWSFYLKATDES